MKGHAKCRPIGKCKGCCLNMRTFCAAGLEPKAEWTRGRCRHHNDAALLDQYYHPSPLTGAKAARRARQASAAMARTEPHYDGLVFVPAREATRASR